jgi:hypothetical protein
MVNNLMQKGGKTPSLVQDGAPTEASNEAPEVAELTAA